VHISDTHVGYRAYNALDDNLGINQREADVYLALEQAVDKILEIRPDVLIHTGDLFDTPRPSNRALSSAFEQLLRISKQDIPVVMITGNHSTPRMRDTGSVFQLFKLLPNFYPIFEGTYEKVHLDKLTIHAIPHCLKKEDFSSQLDLLEIDNSSKYNVLMLHAAVTGIKEFSMGEFNEQEIQTGYLNPQFEYIALGHYHQLTQVEENCFYSGSIERFSFNELNQKKGFIEFDLSTKKMEFHELDIRPMEDLGIIRASNLSSEIVAQKLEEVISSSQIERKIARLTIEDISVPAYNALDFQRIRKLTAPALHFDLRFSKKEEAFQVQAPTSSIGRLTDEYRSYISGIAIDDFDKEKILQLGLEYLESAAQVGENE
jgi:DNA repair exonuclease SbcCD nuclease subunit